MCRALAGIGIQIYITTIEPALYLIHSCWVYLEGRGDLVSRLITPKTHIVTPNSPITNLAINPPSRV